MDNYITIQGRIGGEWVHDYGYLLDNITLANEQYSYRGVPINQTETLHETIINPTNSLREEHEYIKINGVKYYKEVLANGEIRWFSLLNGEIYEQDKFNPQTTSAKEYYKKAYIFKDKIINTYKLGELRATDARDENGNPMPTLGNTKVFDFNNGSGTSIEDPNSEFNQHRLAVIRYAIERNLSIAIANYNSYSDGITTNFQMPKLQEHEWEKIINNVSIISFLQGLNIGGKIYNGYSIITNDKNEELVKEDSICIATTSDNQYHRITDSDLKTKDEYKGNVYGALNVDFDRKFIESKGDGSRFYYIPKVNNGQVITGCYGSIIGSSSLEDTDNIYQYVKKMHQTNSEVASAYFTALGRERESMYKTNNDPTELKKDFGVK